MTSKIEFKESETVLSYLKENSDRLPFKTKVRDVKRLLGGYANYVFRLWFEDRTTAVFKYYGPQMAFMESLESSQFRFHIEKTILGVFGSAECLKQCMVQAPKLLFYEDALHYLIMEDCGETSCTLTDLMRQSFKLSSESENEDEKEKKRRIDTYLTNLARGIQEFTYKISHECGLTPDSHGQMFKNEAYWAVINGIFSSNIRRAAQELDVEKEFAPYYDHKQEQPSVAYFVQGDFWTNAIMVNVETNRAWVLDWETARFDTEYRDLQELGFILWVMRKNPSIIDIERLNHFERQLQLAYFGDENADWRSRTGADTRLNFIHMLVLSYAFKDNVEMDIKLADFKASTRQALDELNEFGAKCTSF